MTHNTENDAQALRDAADALDSGEERFVRGKHSDWLRARAANLTRVTPPTEGSS